MPKKHKPRAGSLQFWPRKRANKILPSVNWKALYKKEQENRILGFIGYKIGMLRVLAKDLTPNSLTKGKQIIIPSTLIECPSMKILAIRFYKDNKVVIGILNENIDKELKRKIKISKQKKDISAKLSEIEKNLDDFDDIRIIVYSVVKQTGIKKTPDIIEIGLGGNISDKFKFIKEHINKEIKIEEFFEKGQIVDVRGVTKAHGFTGPVKRFGIGLKQHKSEKGRRRPGTLGPWRPSRVTFRVAMAGQYGFFTRVHYNFKIIDVGLAKDLAFGLPHHHKIKTSYILLRGSIQGPSKRQFLLTAPLRETKKIAKKNFEIVKLLR